uniref:RING-type E3 ubiquitin transferase n=1 Tax=Athene cunicularia TaxID=194338 RepID=A0A663LYR1_ATHCN
FVSGCSISSTLPACPQCRTTFPERPQLQKNTVLCRVVEQLQGCVGVEDKVKAKEVEVEEEAEEEEAARCGASVSCVLCDSCQQAPAAQTCLTCMAAFCLEHLRPHQDSPAFRDHQLCLPLRHLHRRKCPQHNKLFEFFCSKHGSCLCSLCLLDHKLCHTSPVQLAKADAELALKKKLVELHDQSQRAAQAMNTVKRNQSQAAEEASKKKDFIRSEFLEIKALIEERENQALKIIAEEEKRVCNKFDYIYSVLGYKKKEIQSLTDRIEKALTENDDILFVKGAAALQKTSAKDVFVPVVEMNQNLIHSTFLSTINLKDTVKLSVTQGRETRAEGTVSLGELAFSALALRSNEGFSPSNPNKVQSNPSVSVLCMQGVVCYVCRVSSQVVKLFSSVSTAPTTGTVNTAPTVSLKGLIDSFLKKSRKELLEYAANITLDFNTAHNKVVLSERYTMMSVSDTSLNYNHHPQRFTDCFQVLGFQCFKRGVHYWEVELQQNNFCGIGICYGSMDRQGPESRLGRNSSSWCIEWFNSKISSWHNDVEKCLPNVKTTKVGVLLHCEGGFVIFMAIGEKHNLIYKFKTQFTEALYPAFWLFSSGTVLSLCPMK